MDLDRDEVMSVVENARNGGARVWVESVSAGMRTVEAVIRELSQNDVPVLIVAEHGSGKAAAAARIHALSAARRSRFGSIKAVKRATECLAACDGQGGTVYLQEVARPARRGPKGTNSTDWMAWPW